MRFTLVVPSAGLLAVIVTSRVIRDPLRRKNLMKKAALYPTALVSALLGLSLINLSHNPHLSKGPDKEIFRWIADHETSVLLLLIGCGLMLHGFVSSLRASIRR